MSVFGVLETRTLNKIGLVEVFQPTNEFSDQLTNELSDQLTPADSEHKSRVRMHHFWNLDALWTYIVERRQIEILTWSDGIRGLMVKASSQHVPDGRARTAPPRAQSLHT